MPKYMPHFMAHVLWHLFSEPLDFKRLTEDHGSSIHMVLNGSMALKKWYLVVPTPQSIQNMSRLSNALRGRDH